MTDPYAHDAARAHRLSRGIGRFMHRWRERIRRRPWLNVVYRVLVTVLGLAVVVIGLILVPLPGPGWLIVFLGLTLLGSEYSWARRVLGWLRRVLARFWERWNAWRAARRARREARERASRAAGSAAVS
ncbi:TIGR02611 family protein [Leucobacter chromiireducens]|uniref:TIGR02611 family protein n=1 Tax=Leucobacter chromiireducens TaxID=283877 RepID=UPI001F14E96A|nr:TIGR02611 family protein [Leucobacter chromiireducens]